MAAAAQVREQQAVVTTCELGLLEQPSRAALEDGQDVVFVGYVDDFVLSVPVPVVDLDRKVVLEIDALDVMNISDLRLADRLLQRRQDADLTQKALAHLAGIRVETLNRIEKGRTTPDFKTIRKLVNAINEYNKMK